MKKTRYIYRHVIYGGCQILGRKEMELFFAETGIKLHVDIEKDYYYAWEFYGEECCWFRFSHEEEVEVSEGVTQIPSQNYYENGMNWKNVQVKKANSRLRKPKAPKKKVDNRPPINPRTGLRDGGV